MHFILGWLEILWRHFWDGVYYILFGTPPSIEPSDVVEISTDIRPKKIIGGYFWTGSSKVIRPLQHLNPDLLTHMYYAFLEVEEDGTLTLQNATRSLKLRYPDDVSQYKKQNPHLKILFSVVSKKDSFSIVAADEEKRKIFVESALVLLIKWEFDGLDLDWEFPKEKDKENFVKLLRDISTEFRKHKFLLTAAVRAIPVYDGSGYDVPEMVKYLDIINIMTYDFYGAWSSHTGFNSPLYPSSIDSPYEKKYLNVEAALNNWIEAGASKDKICLGIPFYGRSFTLKNENEHGLHAAVSGGGQPAASTYMQIMQKYNNWTSVWSEEQKAPYKYQGDQWIGYDNRMSIIEKVKFALKQDVAGVFVWQLGGDDITGEVSGGIKQFLLATIYEQMMEPTQPYLQYVAEPISDQDSENSLPQVSERDSEDISIEQLETELAQYFNHSVQNVNDNVVQES